MAGFYQSENAYIYTVGNPSGVLIPNLQSVSTSFTVERVNSMRLGRFRPLADRQAIQDPTPIVNIEFIPRENMLNVLQSMGLMGETAIKDLGVGDFRECDISIQMREKFNTTNTFGKINLTSGVLTNFSFSASVGQVPRVSATYEFLDISIDADSSVANPLVNSDLKIASSRDMEILLPAEIFGMDSSFVQAVSFSMPTPRSPIKRLGSGKSESRNVSSPVMAAMQVQTIVDKFKSTTPFDDTTVEMKNLLCGQWIDGEIKIRVNIPQCSNDSNPNARIFVITMKKPYLESISYSNQVGGFTSAEMSFTCPVDIEDGSDNESNVFISVSG